MLSTRNPSEIHVTFALGLNGAQYAWIADAKRQKCSGVDKWRGKLPRPRRARDPGRGVQTGSNLESPTQRESPPEHRVRGLTGVFIVVFMSLSFIYVSSPSTLLLLLNR